MIATVYGKITAVSEGHLILDVNHIGLRIGVTGETCSKAAPGEMILLYTHLIVREDLLALYGFETEEERHFFTLLLGVEGVGARTALATLSSLTVEAIRRAVLAEQPEVFTRVPGVGRKTGQKIVIHLHGKVGKDEGLVASRELDVDAQVMDALTSLGYSVVEAQAALQSIPNDAEVDIETRLRHALKYFSA